MTTCSSVVRPKLSKDELAASVQALGFTPPQLLVDLLSAVGNGGFGPGYGLLGFVNGASDDLGKTAVGVYQDFRAPDPHDSSWNWPRGMLPICHWGCAIYSCIDCQDDAAPVHTWDPNLWEEGEATSDAIKPMGLALSEWLDAWVRGENLWELMYPCS